MKQDSEHIVHGILFPMGQDRPLIRSVEGTFSCFVEFDTRRVVIEAAHNRHGWNARPMQVPAEVGFALCEIESDSFSKASQHVLCDELGIPHNTEWGSVSIPNRDKRTGCRKSILRLSAPLSGYDDALQFLSVGIRKGQSASLDNPSGGTLLYTHRMGRDLLNGVECAKEQAIECMQQTLKEIENNCLETFKIIGGPDIKRVSLDATIASDLIDGVTPNNKGQVDIFVKPSRVSARGDGVARIVIDAANGIVKVAANEKNALIGIFDPMNLKAARGPYVQEFPIEKAAGLLSHIANCTAEPILERAIPGVQLSDGQSVEFRVIVARAGHIECEKLGLSHRGAEAVGCYTKVSSSPVGNNIAKGGGSASIDLILAQIFDETFPELSRLELDERIATFMNAIVEHSERMGEAIYEYHDSLATHLATPRLDVQSFRVPFLISIDFIPILDAENKTLRPIFLEMGYFPTYEGLKTIAKNVADRIDRYLNQVG